MTVDYNNFAKSFADSRKNMKWAELEYFFSHMQQGSILDIWCGSGRLIEQYNEYFWNLPKAYLWLDLSQGLLDEAKKRYSKMNFTQGNMLNIINISKWSKFSNVFLIASFHHLQSINDRVLFLHNLYQVLDDWARVYMTNWALNSSFNKKRYISSHIFWSENKYGSIDYNIKIGKEMRYYHCFSLEELESLSRKAWFKLIENRLFEGERNFITILEK